jgi:hypothetical protein
MRRSAALIALVAVALVPVGCVSRAESGKPIAHAETTTTMPASPASTTSTTMTTTRVLLYPSGDPVLPGYPMIVLVDTIDERVASWFDGGLVNGQVVALAPGVYTPFNPVVPDLADYFDGPNSGDCVVRGQFFPDNGGACWEGVQAGSAEP